MLWVEAREEQSASVGAREDSEVKLRRREQPFAARLRAIASPIPATVLVSVYSLLLRGRGSPREPPVTMPNLPSKTRAILILNKRWIEGREKEKQNNWAWKRRKRSLLYCLHLAERRRYGETAEENFPIGTDRRNG